MFVVHVVNTLTNFAQMHNSNVLLAIITSSKMHSTSKNTTQRKQD